jgi:hypothetical protein
VRIERVVKLVTECYLGEGGRKGENGLIIIGAQMDESDGRREVVDGAVEVVAEVNMREGGELVLPKRAVEVRAERQVCNMRQARDLLVEKTAERQVCQRGGKTFDLSIEVTAKSKVCQFTFQLPDRFVVEIVPENEVSDRRWQAMHGMVERVPESDVSEGGW